ncbi:MAG: DUF3992 domain-containing protein [Clostridium sp.]|nr:DUF3992 domain-containing protein [Clostridium sp.]
MGENMRRNGYGYYQDSDYCNNEDDHDNRDKICDIKSICCDDFVKEQFSLQTIARNNIVIVYQSIDSNITRGTVKVKNLSSNTSINFTVNSTNIVVGTNQEAAITAANLASVRVQSIGQGALARVKLCFDLQVRSFEG